MADQQRDDDERQDVRNKFSDVVNMSPSELEEWLDTEESQSVGAAEGEDDESVGHRSGRRIVELLGTKVADYDTDAYDHMEKVIGYVHRHLAQRPDGDVTETRWRYSLMNWGHDPLQD